MVMYRIREVVTVVLTVLLVCGGLTGCACCRPRPKPFPETVMVEPVTAPPRPTPTPAPAPVVEPEPVVTPAPEPPPVPPAVVAAVEDLDQRYPNLFEFDRDKGMFQFRSDTTFDSGSTVVKPRARAALEKLAEILNNDQVRDRALTIVGHTDTDRVAKSATIANLRQLGKSADNQGLSEARAEAVAEVLRGGGIDAGRMTTRGVGQTQPIAENRTPEGKARNRRVTIYLATMDR